MNKLITLSLLILLTISFSCKTSVKLGKKNRIVQIDTKYGAVKIKLYDETPGHRDNFIKLADKGFFDGTLFHRVIDGFMIQGGDPDSKGAKPGDILGEGGPGYDIPAEINVNLFQCYCFMTLTQSKYHLIFLPITRCDKNLTSSPFFCLAFLNFSVQMQALH